MCISSVLICQWTHLCTHLKDGRGLPSARHSKAAGLKSGAVVRRSGPAEIILGGSERKGKHRRKQSWVKTLSKVNSKIRTFHIQLHRQLLRGAHRVLCLAGVQSGIATTDGTQLQCFLWARDWRRRGDGRWLGSAGNLIQLQISATLQINSQRGGDSTRH